MCIWATQIKLERLLFAVGQSPGIYYDIGQESNGFKKTEWFKKTDFDFIHNLYSICKINNTK